MLNHYQEPRLERHPGNRRMSWLAIVTMVTLCWIGAMTVGAKAAEFFIWMATK